ncbi:MAG: DNA translocase FtsK, partial [Candidatus Gracilibacteria bacterium]|nr:DNA translocase FtsK [Candidatus Gracilibacteria bacterium]
LLRQVTDKTTEMATKAIKNSVSEVSKDLTNSKKTIEKNKKDDVYDGEIKKINDKIEVLKKETEKEKSSKKVSKEQLPLTPQLNYKVKVEKKSILDIFNKDKKEENNTKNEKTGTKQLSFPTREFPKTELLNKFNANITYDRNLVEQKMLEIQKTLLQFKIEVDMKGYQVGPTVIQYRLKPSEGVKLTKIENLKKDLSLALKAKNIFIQAPIPGLGLVGIEVPNEERQIIGIREVLESREFTGSKSNLSLVIGKDINGNYIVGDLSKMPHLLIAGQTGSGKSVGMNGFLLSLLYKNSPETLRMIMVDPKRVELGIYNGIPHLLTPVINESGKALNALKWGVVEMTRRYELLTQVRARNIDEYNAKVNSRKDRIPNIVIVIDELADLMLSGNKKEVEHSITRIAQMARAVGIHLILATQRPSVDVITGIIKANVPSRISFTVASQVDSRTILDRIGAEDLLGKGDMFYLPSGAMNMERIQGVFVSTDEVEAVVNRIKMTIDPRMLEELYDSSIVEGDGKGEYSSGDSSKEEGEMNEDKKVIEEAIRVVREAGKASTSLLQRKMKLGYSRAARLMDILEELGIVGPADGSKPRQVL